MRSRSIPIIQDTVAAGIGNESVPLPVPSEGMFDRTCPNLKRNLRIGGYYRFSIRAAKAGNAALSSLDDNASICSNSCARKP